jgi:hypothetical protein
MRLREFSLALGLPLDRINKMANRITTYCLCFGTLIIASCAISQKMPAHNLVELEIVKSAKDLDKLNQYDTVIVEGKLKHFKPWFPGKGGGTQHFNFEIRLNDNGELPLHKTAIIGKEFLNKKVKVVGIYECEGMSRAGDIGFQDINVRRIQKILSIEIL